MSNDLVDESQVVWDDDNSSDAAPSSGAIDASQVVWDDEPQSNPLSGRLESMHKASTDTPEDVAKWDGLAKQAGVSYNVAKTIPDQVEKKLNPTDWDGFAADAPKTAQFLSDNPRVFEKAKGDIQALRDIEKARTAGSFAHDLGIRAIQGVSLAGQSVIGTTDMALKLSNPIKAAVDLALDRESGTLSGLLSDAGISFNKANEAADALVSDASKQDSADVNAAFDDGLGSGGRALVERPAFIAEKVVQSAPQMLVAMAAVRQRASQILAEGGEAALKAAMPELAKLSAAIEGAQTAGNYAGEKAEDGDLAARESLAAAGQFVTTAAIGQLSNKIGGLFGINDVEAAVASGIKNNFSSVTDYLSKLGGTLIKEGPLEEGMQSATEQGWANFGDGQDLLQGTGRAFVEGSVVGAAQGGTLMTAKSGVDAVSNLLLKAQESADRTANDVNALDAQIDAIAKTKLAQLDKEDAVSVLNNMDGGEIGYVYVDSALFHTGVVTKDVFLNAAPSAADQIDQEMETGGLIRVPRNELMVGLSQNPEIRGDVLAHVKSDVFGDTQSELGARQSELDKELEEVANKAISMAKDKEKAADDFKEAADHIASQLDATGYGTKEGNKTRAILLASRASVIAYNNGMKPLEVVNKYMGKFRFDPKNETLPKQDGGVFNQYAGEQAQGADLTALQRAKQAVDSGADPEQTRQETGWHKWEDGKWRFEIDDSQAKQKLFSDKGYFGEQFKRHVLNEGDKPDGYSSLKVGDILDHSALFDAYPNLADIRIVPEKGAGASFSSGQGDPVIGIGTDKPMKDVKSAILHEIQHAIQEQEGFARGGSVGEFMSPADNELAADQYKKLAGEVEARDTQARAGMSAEERKLNKPYISQGIPDDQVIVRKAKEGGRFNQGGDYNENNAPDSLSDDAADALVELYQELGSNDDVFQYSRDDTKELDDSVLSAAPEGTKQIADDLVIEMAKEDAEKAGQPAIVDVKKYVVPTKEVIVDANNKPILKDGKKQYKEHKRDAYVYVNELGEYWVDLSNLKRAGGVGGMIYTKVADFAAKNGGVFRGDPMGLSDDALLKRTEHMASGIARRKQSASFVPHDRQLNPYDEEHKNSPLNKHVRPIQWTNGNDTMNRREIVKTAFHNITQVMPELRHAWIDPDTGRILQRGSPISAKFNDWVSDLQKKEADQQGSVLEKQGAPLSAYRHLYASASIKRQLLANTIARYVGEGGQGRRQLLDKLGERFKDLEDQDDRKLFYQSKNAKPFDGKEVAKTKLPEDTTHIDVDGVSRPALNSNGEPIHWSEEGTRNFWRWFGDSKVVDADGRPLVVYHGTENNFSAFDKRLAGANTSHPTSRLGHYLSSSPEVAGLFVNAKANTQAETDAFTASRNAARKVAKSYGFDDVTYMPVGSEQRKEADRAGKAVYEEMAYRNRAQIMPLYLSIKNPLTLTWDEWFKAADWVSGTHEEGLKEILEKAKSGGHDGLILPRQDGKNREYAGDTYIAFEPTQIKSATGNSGAFDGKDPSILRQDEQDPRGTFDPVTRDITMLAKADLSTFLHETGHLFLEIQAELAMDENATDRMKSDMDAVLQWFGVEGKNASERLAAWNAMTLEQKRPLHEKYAESFEQYLFEGKAPSAELKEAFQTFKAWLSHVYTSIKNFLSESGQNADLNDEIRSVFDRMLATEEQIAQAQQTAGMMPMYASRPEGVSDAEWEAYQQAADEYVQAATEQLSGRVLRDLKWVKNAVGTKGKIMREMRREAAALRREARMEARTRFLSRPIVQAYQFLTAPVEGVKARNKRARNSEHVDTARDSLFTAIAKLGGLNKEEAVSQYGLDPKDFLRKGGVFGKPVLRVDGGLSPDAMAEALSQFNYLPLDEHGKWDILDLEDLLREEAAGNPQYSTDVDMDVLLGEPQRAFFDTENVEYMGGRLNRIDIRNMFDDIQLAEMAGIDPYTGEAVATESQQEGNNGASDGSNPNILRQNKKQKNKDIDLFVAHNLSEENLIHADELGGLAAPSLGVSRTTTGGFGGFGGITLLADKEILTDRYARTFDADVYSPRHPRAQENISYDSYIDLVQRIKANQGEVEGLDFRVDHDSLMRNGANDLANSEAFQNYYLVSKGIIIKPKKAKAAPAILNAIKYLKKNAKHDSAYAAYNLRDEDWFKSLAEEHYKAEFEKWKNLRDDFTPAELVKYGPFEEDGSLKYHLYNGLALEVENYHKKGGQDSAATRGAIAKHFRTDKGSAELQEFARAELAKISSGKQLVKYTKNGNQKRSAYTLENIVSEMTRELRGGEGFNYGAGSVRSAFAFEFKHNTIESIKSHKENIVSKQEMDMVRDDANNKLSEALDKLAKFYKYDSTSWGYTNDASSAIAEGPKGWSSAFKMTTESKKIITDLVTYLRSLPSEYFETKMQRAVGIGEFKTAVVPKGISAMAMAILEKNGLNVVTYDPKKEGSRTAAIAKQKDILFQKKGKDSKPENRTLESMGVMSDDGILPELVAGYFGMETEQLIRGLLGTPELGDIKQAIENMTDQIMLERHADLATPEAMAEATLKAVMNKARAKFVATEYAILAKAAGGARATEKQAKEYAQRVIGETKVKDVKPEKFIAAAAKAGKEAQKAMAKSDTKAALLAKRNQVLNEATAKLAVDVKEEIGKFDDLAAKIIKATNEKNAKRGRDPDVVNAITAVMGFYGFYPSRQQNAMEYLERVREHDPDMFLRLQDAVNRAAVNQKDFNDLTINEMRGLREEIEGLWYTAKRSRQMEIDGKKIDLQEAADGLVTRLLEVGLPDEKLGAKNAPTEKDLLTHKLKTAGAWLTRVEQWAERMDGQWGGAFTRYIFQPVKKAADRYRTEATEYNRRYVALIDALPKMKRGLIAAPELGYTFGAGDQKVGMAELLHAVLHTGNASNKRKLLLGRGWAVLREDGTLDTARWDVFVERMHKQGVLKKEHYDFAQGVWDLLEDTKAGAQKTHRDVFGYYFAEVTADAFGTPFGIYRGGYVPAQADPRLVVDAAQRAMAEEENNTLVNAFPATAKGFTKGRTEYNKPLMLDLQSLSQHINKVLLFTHMEPAVRDVKKLLMRNDVAETLGAVDRAAYDSMLTPWLSVAARQSVNTPVTGDAGISNAVNIVRNNTGMALMAANLSNAMQQITGFLTATQKVKGKYMLRETASFLARPKEYANEVRAASEYMAVRMDAEIRAINSQINELLIAPTAYQKTKAFAARHAYFLQAMMDNTMSPIIWRATFNQGVEQGMTDADAEQYANATIRQTQGSSLPEDVSRVEVGGAFWRATMQFYGYFNSMVNTNVVAVKNAKTKSEAMGHIIYGAILPAIVAQSIAVAMRGGVDDDDYDGWLDDWITEVAGTGLFRYATAMVPVVGAFANLAVGYTTKTPVDDRMQTSATTSMIGSALRSVDSVPDAITGNGKPSKAIKDVAAGISLFTGLPVFALARPVGYAADVAAGEVVPTSGGDMTRGLLTGTASPDSK